jgi:hypothetical protein
MVLTVIRSRRGTARLSWTESCTRGSLLRQTHSVAPFQQVFVDAIRVSRVADAVLGEQPPWCFSQAGRPSADGVAGPSRAVWPATATGTCEGPAGVRRRAAMRQRWRREQQPRRQTAAVCEGRTPRTATRPLNSALARRNRSDPCRRRTARPTVTPKAELHRPVGASLEAVLGIRFLASECPTGPHTGARSPPWDSTKTAGLW